MKKRMWALLLAGVLTIGQCGTVVFAADETGGQPIVAADEPTAYAATSVTPNKTSVVTSGGSIIFTVDEQVNECVVKEGERILSLNVDYTVNADIPGKYIVTFPENSGTSQRTFTVILDGIETSITQDGKPAIESTISDVILQSRTVLADGKVEFTYDVSGDNIEEVGIKIKEGSYKTTLPYNVGRVGTGEKQTVTITFDKYTDPWDVNLVVHFYPTSDTSITSRNLNE